MQNNPTIISTKEEKNLSIFSIFEALNVQSQAFFSYRKTMRGFYDLRNCAHMLTVIKSQDFSYHQWGARADTTAYIHSLGQTFYAVCKLCTIKLALFSLF